MCPLSAAGTTRLPQMETVYKSKSVCVAATPARAVGGNRAWHYNIQRAEVKWSVKSVIGHFTVLRFMVNCAIPPDSIPPVNQSAFSSCICRAHPICSQDLISHGWKPFSSLSDRKVYADGHVCRAINPTQESLLMCSVTQNNIELEWTDWPSRSACCHNTVGQKSI